VSISFLFKKKKDWPRGKPFNTKLNKYLHESFSYMAEEICCKGRGFGHFWQYLKMVKSPLEAIES